MNATSTSIPVGLAALDQWRNDILNLQLRLLLLLAAPTVITDSVGGLQRGEFVPLLVNMIISTILVVLALLPRRYYRLRVISFLVICFGFGAFVLFHTGLVGAGRLFLLVAVILTSFFFGVKTTVALWLLSAAIMIGIFSAYALGWIETSETLLQRVSDPFTLMTNGISTIYMGAVLAGAVLVLVKRLSHSLYDVEAANALLEQRVADRTAELQATLRTNRFLVAAVNNMSTGVLVSDAVQADNPTIFVNPAFTTISGYQSEEVIGQNCRFLQGPHTDPAATRAIRMGIAARQPVRVELLNYRKDGTTFWNELAISPVFDDAGALIGFVGLQSDVTVRKETELALKQINQTLQQRVDELLALNRITQALARWTNPNEALDTVSTSIARLFNASVVSVWEVEQTRCALVRIGPRARDAGDVNDGVVNITDYPIIRRVVDNGQMLMITAAECDALGPAWCMPTGGAGILLPLLARGGSIGALWMRARDEGRVFTPSEVGLAQTIAGVVAVTVENGRLFRQARHVAAEEERRRLARELHDSVSQSLFAASVSADVVPQIWELDPDEGREVLEQIKRLTRGALAEMRTLLVELRPGALVHTPLDLLFEHLVAAASTRLHGTIEVALAAMPALPPDVRIAFYRIGQEALSNVIKHAHARRTTICLTADPPAERDSLLWQGTVGLTVSDDGQGFDQQQHAGGGLGLIGLRERAAAINATLGIETAVGVGTTISVRWSGAALVQQERQDG